MALGALTLGEVAAAIHARTDAAATAAAAPLGGVSIDSRTLEPGELFFAIAGPRHDGHEFLLAASARGAAAAVVHKELAGPGQLPLLRVADTTRALKALAQHRRLAAELPVVAITGSTGKTTTKDMTAALVASRGPVLKTEGNQNNQYGVPLTLLRLAPEHRVAVLELGMSAPGELLELAALAAPELAVITNVGSAHLGFFSSLDEIAQAKGELLAGLGRGGRAILNADDPRVRRLGEAWGGPVIWFGRDRRCDVSAENWRGTAFGMRFDLLIRGARFDVALPLPGPHFMLDFLAAAAAAHALGVSPASIAEAAPALGTARHRGELLRLGAGIVLLDDCYNSSPEGLDAAVAALMLAGGERRVAVLGDMLELGERGPVIHRQRGAAFAGSLGLLAAVGPLGRELAAGAQQGGLPARAIHLYETAAAAAAGVPSLLRPRDAVLVKGSRALGLERVVEAIAASFPEGA